MNRRRWRTLLPASRVCSAGVRRSRPRSPVEGLGHRDEIDRLIDADAVVGQAIIEHFDRLVQSPGWSLSSSESPGSTTIRRHHDRTDRRQTAWGGHCGDGATIIRRTSFAVGARQDCSPPDVDQLARDRDCIEQPT
jgi:hypothetical protein